MTWGTEALSRNAGLISVREQERLEQAAVLVAGVGGIGGRVAETLARLGVGRLLLADPDVFTISNLNRQAGCTHATLGMNKAEAIADLCRSVSTHISAVPVVEGITVANVRTLVSQVDLVIDGTDYGRPDIGLHLGRASREAGKPVLLGVEVGFGAWFTVLRPGGATFERVLGLPSDVTPQQLLDGAAAVPLWRWVGRLPRYADPRVLQQIERDGLEAPAVAPAVELAAALLSTASMDLLIGRKPCVEAPRICHVDARTGEVARYRTRRIGFIRSALLATWATRRRA